MTNGGPFCILVPHEPLPLCHLPDGENTKAWDLIANGYSDPNDRSHSLVISKLISLMKKSTVKGGNSGRKPFSLERKKGMKKENNANSNSSK